jgi:hypothetical protein
MVVRRWPDSTVVCVASGPSLTQADVDLCRDRARVIVVNDNYRLAPWADVLYAADAAWWRLHQGVPGFVGLKYSIGSGAPKGVIRLRNTGNSGLEVDPSGLRTGRNSGYQAINLAVHFGARRILLLGYDCQGGVTGTSHWFGEHPHGLNRPSTAMYQSWQTYFATLVAPLASLGVDVINCSRRTAVTCFPRQSLTEALAVPLEAAS